MEFVLTEYLRMSGVYWGLTCLELMGRLDSMDPEPILSWVLRCQVGDTWHLPASLGRSVRVWRAGCVSTDSALVHALS